MKIEELIEEHEADLAAKAKEQKQKMNDLIETKKLEFQQQAKTAAGDLWDQLSPREVISSLSDHEREIRYEIPVTWGKTGFIRQAFCFHTQKWDRMYLDFGYGNDGSQAVTLCVELPNDDKRLGYLFSDMKRCSEHQKKLEAAHKERDVNQLLNFSNLNEKAVEERLKAAIEKYPEFKMEFTEQAEKQRTIIAQETEKMLKAHLAYELVQSEKEQLEHLVEFAWRGPFELIKVKYGANVQGNEDYISVHTEHFYTLMTEDKALVNEGYYRAFEDGKYTRRVRPVNIISYDRVTISGMGDVPDDLRRWIVLESKVVKDVSIHTFIPPIELFAFDYDQLRVAVEAEQEAEENADAAQKDNS